MSTTLADNEVTEFGMVVKHAYQGGGKLRSAVRLQTGVVGGTYRFPKIGKGQATPRIPQTNVVPMNVAHTKAEATITDWIAAEYTDIFNQQKVNYSERQLLGHIIAMAIGRREDQLLIDAWDAETHTNTVAEGIGGSNPLNVGKFLRSSRLMTEDGVPSTDRYMTLSAFGLENMLGITEATSSDFNSVKALVNGEINTYSGFQTIVIEERDEGGLPVATSIVPIGHFMAA